MKSARDDSHSNPQGGWHDSLRLDAIDLRILDAVQRDGRMTKLALAEKVGLSPTPCWLRLRKLEKAGIISGYHAKVASRALAPVTTVLMEVTLGSHRQADFDRFERVIREFPRSSPAGRSAAASITC